LESLENPTIVVVGYNRLHSLQRLLSSLSKATYDSHVNLVISVDGPKAKENLPVINYCQNFHWEFGKKELIIHKINLGLKSHIFSCFDLTSKYGSIILLEDDDYVSPDFYRYSCYVKQFYTNKSNIFGFSLISLLKNGYLNTNFYPILDDNDVIFVQLGFVHGFILDEKNWLNFKTWFSVEDNKKLSNKDNLHTSLLSLDQKKGEWFQLFTKFIVNTNKFVVYPRNSLNINFHEPGAHTKKISNWYQFPLSYRNENFVFKNFEDSLAIYDSFFEILTEILKLLNNKLTNFDFDIDLNATKSKKDFNAEYILSTREPVKFIISFGREMKPLEQNIIENIQGIGIYLAKKDDFRFSKLKELKIRRKNHYFYNQGLKKDLQLKFFFIGILTKLKII
jgi:hypothetical protein